MPARGGAKALLGQASQAATGMAMQAAGTRLGPMGAPVTGAVTGAIGGMKSLKPDAAPAPAAVATAGRTPGFTG